MKSIWKYLFCALTLLSAGLLLGGCGQGDPAETENVPAETLPRTYLDPADTDTVLRIRPENTIQVIGNKLSNMNMWNYNMFWKDAFPAGHFAQTYPFVKEMQFMTATGGELNRELFVNPSDRSVLDDYDFTPLVNACRNVVEQGLKPMIKTGNIPQKYSSVSTTGTFGVNLYPPDDYTVYYNYIRAMTQTLADTFGLDEVRTWRWGCFTEYENADWFQGTCEDYCRIYDYTVAAIQSVLGFDIAIGAHSMTCSEGLWDERQFIDHCINGTNYCTGEQGTRLTYLAASYYDEKISALSAPTKRLTKTINVLRDAANASIDTALAAGISKEHLDSLGVTSLYYGVDEGRILVGSKGRDDAALSNRIVGHTKQAAYDAMILEQMVTDDIDYFSAWAYHSDQFYGLPTVSWHVADNFWKMVGTTQVETIVERKLQGAKFPRTQNCIASTDENGTVYAMLYDFGDDLNEQRPEDVTVGNTVHLLVNLDCTKVKLTLAYVNNDSNFFDEWMADCEEAGITKDDFSWSPDSTYIPSNLTSDAARLLFNRNYPKYTECAALQTETVEVAVSDGELYYPVPLAPNSVVFCTIEPLA